MRDTKKDVLISKTRVSQKISRDLSRSFKIDTKHLASVSRKSSQKGKPTETENPPEKAHDNGSVRIAPLEDAKDAKDAREGNWRNASRVVD